MLSRRVVPHAGLLIRNAYWCTRAAHVQRYNDAAAKLASRCAELEKQAMNLSQKGGYRVLVPDLYKGKLGTDKEEAHHVGA